MDVYYKLVMPNFMPYPLVASIFFILKRKGETTYHIIISKQQPKIVRYSHESEIFISEVFITSLCFNTFNNII